MKDILNYYKNKRVLVTGNTGFKGSWLCELLTLAGADVTGYSLNRHVPLKLFYLAGLDKKVNTVTGDIRNLDIMNKTFDVVQPEIVFHLAAQPLVRESYKDPAGTYAINVMGTVNVLECVRNSSSVKSFLNVTTDKVYENKERSEGYTEDEPLDGYDPYSNSKSCSELVTHSYKKCFFADGRCAISTARAGNVIGGGDFSKDRIIPDCVKAAINKENIIVRNPYSTRPYQHVLEPLFAYLMIAARQYDDVGYSGYYNVGPDDTGCYETGALVDLFIEKWGEGIKREDKFDGGPHEANYLKLDSTKIKKAFGWEPKWTLETAVEKTVEWTKWWVSGRDVNEIMLRQIGEYING